MPWASTDKSLEAAFREVPVLLRKVWGGEVTMLEVQEYPSLQSWGFFDGEEAPSAATSASKMAVDSITSAAFASRPPSTGLGRRTPASSRRSFDSDRVLG